MGGGDRAGPRGYLCRAARGGSDFRGSARTSRRARAQKQSMLALEWPAASSLARADLIMGGGPQQKK